MNLIFVSFLFALILLPTKNQKVYYFVTKNSSHSLNSSTNSSFNFRDSLLSILRSFNNSNESLIIILESDIEETSAKQNEIFDLYECQISGIDLKKNINIRGNLIFNIKVSGLFCLKNVIIKNNFSCFFGIHFVMTQNSSLVMQVIKFYFFCLLLF